MNIKLTGLAVALLLLGTLCFPGVMAEPDQVETEVKESTISLPRTGGLLDLIFNPTFVLFMLGAPYQVAL